MSERTKVKRLGPVEILVVVFVFLLLIAVIIGGSRGSRVDARRVECQKNLSVIAKAMQLYANDYDGAFPRAGGRDCMWDRDIPNWTAPNRFAAYGMAANGEGARASISSCFYLLVKYAELLPRTFVCPGDVGTTEFKLADVDAGDRKLIDLWDFGPDAYRHCSYAYQMPFSWFALTTSSEPAMAVAADRNPWMDSPASKAKDMMSLFIPDASRDLVKVGNAIAHEEEGQNVLFVDGHVRFEDKSFCGVDDDNIYTYWDGGDIRRGARPFLGGNCMVGDERDSLLVHDPQVSRVTVTTKRPKSLRSTDLTETSVVATLDCPLPAHKNVIWCSTFQMAWDKLKNDVIGESLDVRDAEEVASRLNAGQFDHRNLEDKSFYATAGVVGEEIVDQIQKEMADRFPSEPVPVFDEFESVPLELRDGILVAYSYLNVDVDFKHPFYTNERAFEFRDSRGIPTSITSFRERAGSDSSRLVREQVDVLYYRDTDRAGAVDFVVDLSKQTDPHQVVLARMRRNGTFGQSVAAVEEKISEFEVDPDYGILRNLRSIDRLIVPDVLYKLTHHFTDLEGKRLRNRKWFDYKIFYAMQKIDFGLSRTGVMLKSEARIGVAPPLAMDRRQIIEPRHFYFNSPFLIYVKKRGDEYSPFFVMWVDNAELMQEFSSSTGQ